jgi:hypothetical protein
MPLTPLPSTVHGSPTCAGSGSSGKQRHAFQLPWPSFDHGMHLLPRGQSSVQKSHSMSAPPPSGSTRNILGRSDEEEDSSSVVEELAVVALLVDATVVLETLTASELLASIVPLVSAATMPTDGLHPEIAITKAQRTSSR